MTILNCQQKVHDSHTLTNEQPEGFEPKILRLLKRRSNPMMVLKGSESSNFKLKRLQ